MLPDTVTEHGCATAAVDLKGCLEGIDWCQDHSEGGSTVAESVFIPLTVVLFYANLPDRRKNSFNKNWHVFQIRVRL